MNQLSDLLIALRELGNAYWAFSALSVALEVGLLEELVVPRHVTSVAKRVRLPIGQTRGILEVLLALGLSLRQGNRWQAAPALLPLLAPPALTFWRAEMRTVGRQARKFLEDAERGYRAPTARSWADAELIQAQGLVSAVATDFLIATAIRQATGLLECLRRPGALFLDAGAGACGAAITLGRRFPGLSITALEPDLTARRLARRNLKSAGLQRRVKLFKWRAESLNLRNVFDVAYLAQAFFPEASLRLALRTVRAALRPGGYLITSTLNAHLDGLAAAVAWLRSELWGGGPRPPADVAHRLMRAGYVEVTVLAGQAEVSAIVGRRAVSRTAGSRPGFAG